MKRIASVLLTLVMILGLAVSAFADGETTAGPTISVTDDRTYEVYQIFTGDLHDGVLSNIEWGENGTGVFKERVEQETLKTLTDLPDTASVQEKLAVIEPLVDFTSEAHGTVSKAQALSVDPGYYLLKDVTVITGDDENSIFVVEVVDSVTVTPKVGDVTSDKKVKDTNDTTGETTDWQDSADYDIGDDVPFRLKGTVSANYDFYDRYYYCFHDTLSAGLTFNAESVVVKVDGTAITGGYTVVTAGLEDGCTFEVEFADLKEISAVRAGSVITVEYTAELNDNAVLGSAGNPNTMHLEFSNNPNGAWENGENGTPEKPVTPDTGETPDDKVIVFTYKLEINKVDEDGNALKGAGFTLYKKAADGSWAVVGEGEMKGEALTTFTWTGLDDGTYKLSETTTPAGYNTMADIEFEITAEHEIESADPKLISLSGGDVITGELKGDSTETTETEEYTGTLKGTVENKHGTVLPETGAAGTMMFIAIGAALALIAVVFLVTRKKMSVYEN